MQSILGALPAEFTNYWIARFPRLLSHSYHSLERCSSEHSFLAYYPKSYTFSKPKYFEEETEDFVPTEQMKLSRDSPKKYFKYKLNENFGNGSGNMMRRFENFARPTKKGSYNFHKNFSNNNNNGNINVSSSTSDFNTANNNGDNSTDNGTNIYPNFNRGNIISSDQQQPPNLTTSVVDNKTDQDGFKLVKRNVNTKRRNDGKTMKQEHVKWVLPNENN